MSNAIDAMRKRFENYTVDNPVINQVTSSNPSGCDSFVCDVCKKNVPISECESHINAHQLEITKTDGTSHSENAVDDSTAECEFCQRQIPLIEYESHIYCHQLELEGDLDTSFTASPDFRPVVHSSSPSSTLPSHPPPIPPVSADASPNRELLQLPVTEISTASSNTNGQSQTITTTYRRLPDGRDFVVIEQKISGQLTYRREEFRQARGQYHQEPQYDHHPQQHHHPNPFLSPFGGGFGGLAGILGGGHGGGGGLNIDGMDYNQLLDLENHIGNVNVGLSREQFNSLPHFPYQKPTMPSASDENMCSICQTDFEPGEEIICTLCIHRYHPDCLWNWLKNNKTCPICKKDVRNPG